MVGRLADQAVTDGIDEGQLTDYATMRAQLRADLAPPAKRARQQMPAAASAPEFSLIGCYAKNTGSPPGAMQAPEMPPPPPEPVDEAEAERRQKRAARFRVVQPKAGGSDQAAAAAPAPTVAPDRTKGPEHQWCILDNTAGAAQREPDLVQQWQFPESLGLPPSNRGEAGPSASAQCRLQRKSFCPRSRSAVDGTAASDVAPLIMPLMQHAGALGHYVVFKITGQF